ncbi:MHJ_0274 family protein [Mycoplasmopsis gallopavonis]|uniref:Uncharacterized protein n=1 Tax=Mycoplasmopsis gallopavonis TaxID=76629 RepID=A0A449B053_9BACT|nr:hypothetical protein [Mycoplasmopsis gallopavonis]RIV16846.1 hypothetical protein D1113_00695 [Mycoplasmopsis gallopavonis]VEU73150.1 Uncharacterised protein [Mycoplasmopsis gallopavonis]
MITNLETLKAETNNSSSSSIFSGDSSILLWIVLGILVLLILIFFAYSWIKDKIDKKKLREATFELQRETAIYFWELNVKLLKLWELNKQSQADFVPSIGEYKMSDLNRAAKQVLEKEIKSVRFQACFKETELHNLFVKNLFKLKDTNANLWEKHLPTFKEYLENNLVTAQQELDDLSKTAFVETRKQDLIEQDTTKEYHEFLK